jgi:hypothetical protein
MLSVNLRGASRIAALGALGLALGLGACATPNYDQEFAQINEQFIGVNTRLDSIDTRVADAMARADAAGQAANAASAEARAASQRVDQMNMQRMQPRSPRG